MPWGWIFAQIIKDERSTKVAKWWSYIDVWPFYGEVCFPMHLYGHHIFVWENVENFKRLLWSFWASIAQILCGAFLGWGNEKLLKWSRSIDQDGQYIVKTFKNPLLQNQISPRSLSLHKSSGTGDLPKLLKWWSYVDISPFYGKVKFAFLTFVWALYIYMEKCWKFIFWTSPLQSSWIETWWWALGHLWDTK